MVALLFLALLVLLLFCLGLLVIGYGVPSVVGLWVGGYVGLIVLFGFLLFHGAMQHD